jgi:hypothetical protein
MDHCPNCNHSFAGKRCPICGGPSDLTPRQINDALRMYMFLNFGGFFGIFLLTWPYRLLDQDPILAASLSLCFAPMLTHLFLAISKRASANLELLKRAYGWSGAASIALALLLLMNVALDGHAPELETSAVVKKSASRGRSGMRYTVILSPSWRPGRGAEKLRVNEQAYASVRVGEPVAVEVHAGTFGLAWYAGVRPQ